VFGVGALFVVQRRRALWVLHLVPLCVVVYLVTGIVGSNLPIRDAMLRGVQALPGVLGTEERVGSLQFRFDHEEVLAQRTRERPFWGWGGWGRSRVESDLAWELLGRQRVITDGFWIIAFGDRGLVGLVTTYGWMLVPGVLAISLLRRAQAPLGLKLIVAGLYLWTTLYAADLLLNSFVSPVQGLVAGGLAGFVAQVKRRRLHTPNELRDHWTNGAVGSSSIRGSKPPRELVARQPVDLVEHHAR